VARFAGEEQAVFVASKASGVKTFEEARASASRSGPRTPWEPTSRGASSRQGRRGESYFSEMKEHRYHEVR